MGDKDLENIIRAVASGENDAMQKQKEVERLIELVEKQKQQIVNLEKALQDEAGKLTITGGSPPDVELLKQRVGEMRDEVNQKDALLETKYNEVNRLKSDLNFLRNQFADASQDVQRTNSENATIRGTLLDKEKLLEERTRELQAKTEALTKIEANDQDIIKLREELQSTQNDLVAREELMLEKDTRITELEAKINISQTSDNFKAEVEKLRGELVAKDIDLKMQESTIAELKEQLEFAKRQINAPDQNAGQITTLTKQLQQMRNENAKLSLKVKLHEERNQEQNAIIVTLKGMNSPTTSTPTFPENFSGARFIKKVILHTDTKEECYFEI